MNTNEKILLLELILRDIRGDWGYELDYRVNEALKIAEDLRLKKHIDSLNEFTELMGEGMSDGRFFRMSYKDGGYENMDKLHNLSKSYVGKSEEFEQSVLRILNYPEVLEED